MVDLRALPLRVVEHQVFPDYLDARDVPWLTALIAAYDRFADRPRHVRDRFFRSALEVDAPPRKLHLARQTLDKLWSAEVKTAVLPKEARARVFMARASFAGERAALMAKTARELEITVEELEHALFADLPGERILRPPDSPLSPADLALRTNLLLVQRLLFRSIGLRLQVFGNARAIVRLAKLRGLICTVENPERNRIGATRLVISGPLSLFRHTLVYGRALAELPAHLSWCRRFCLDAWLFFAEEKKRLRIEQGAPIFPAKAPRPFDSRLEERFLRDFERRTPDWDAVREPEPISVGGSLIFPDFALVQRRAPFARWWLEIIGFWTPDYLTKKLERLRHAGLDRLILCVDARQNCGASKLPNHAQVIRFSRRIDVKAILRVLDPHGAGSPRASGYVSNR